MNNLHIYDAGRSVPETAVKKISGGAYGAAGLSDINPQWRIEKLTEIFGACGVGWYFEPENIWINDGTMYAHVMLYHMTESGEWSKPVHGYGGTKLTGRDDDAVKSTITDAFGNACRYLGIGADVWMPKNGASGKVQFDTKYSAPPVEPSTPKPEAKSEAPVGGMPGANEKPCDPKQVKIIADLSTPDELKALKKLYGESFERLSLDGAVKVIAKAKEARAKNGGN